MGTAPFSAEQFFASFAAYNAGVWPFQFVLATAALLVAVAVWGGWRYADRIALAFLALLWVWAGVAYHLLHFTAVTPAAYGFALLFVAGGVAFGLSALRGSVRLQARPGVAGLIGSAAIAYALVLYPLVGWLMGHRYPLAPTFGAPCPTTIYTFGLLFWSAGRVPGRLLVAPALWALIGSTAALQWGMLEDLAMPVLAVFAVGFLARRNRRRDLGAERSIARSPEPQT